MIDTSHSLQSLNASSENTLISHLGIEYTDISEDYLCGKMPVDNRTVQPHKSLHGGASSAFAETLASMAASLCIDAKTSFIAALNINSHFLKAERKGYVYGKAVPVKLSKSAQVWEVNITNESGQLVCTSNVRLAVLPKR